MILSWFSLKIEAQKEKFIKKHKESLEICIIFFFCKRAVKDTE